MIDLTKGVRASKPFFMTYDEGMDRMQKAEKENDHLRLVEYGKSEEGRSLWALRAGSGPKTIVLAAGAHADEPVGPETLRRLCGRLPELLNAKPGLKDQLTLLVLPHVNPDSEQRNRPWIDRWPDLEAYLKHVDRERPGRDIEFGYPDLRPENQAFAQLIADYAPIDLYINLHGMAVAEGVMLLIERHVIDRAEPIKRGFRQAVKDLDLPLHDHDRKGEKGFRYLGPGFTTTPDGEAMHHHFMQKGDEQTARLFMKSSMEWIRSRGGDPLCLVTEIPLWLVQFADGRTSPAGMPMAYLSLKKKLPELKLRADRGEPVELEEYEMETLSLRTAIKLQQEVLRLGMASVGLERLFASIESS